MAIKTSNVAARVEPDVKEKAEAILASLGISVSAGINMFYRQIILMNGLPFRPSIPIKKPTALEDMSREEFDAVMAEGIREAEADMGMPAEAFFKKLQQE